MSRLMVNTVPIHESRQLEDEDLLPAEGSCPLCGSNTRKAIAELQRKPRVELMSCSCCHGASASRLPSDETLAAYYGGYYDTPVSSSQDAQVTFYHYERLARHVLRHITPHLQGPSLRILDFGGGDGAIANAFARQLLHVEAPDVSQIDITVVDPSEAEPQPSQDAISIEKCRTIDEVSGSFQLVIASASLEHIQRPVKELSKLTAILDPGGTFYARTPYVSPLVRLFDALGMRWNFMYPAHLHDMGQQFWEGYIRRDSQLELLRSTPSIVETTFDQHFLRTLAAYLLKAPWYLLGQNYGLVGGWEIFARKATAVNSRLL